MQSTRSPRSVSPLRAEYAPSSSSYHRSISPYSTTSNGTQSPGPNIVYNRPLPTSHTHPSPSSRNPARSLNTDMYNPPISSAHLHPSLSTAQRHHTGPIRTHQHRSSSRPSTASSMDDNGDASNYSDYDWRPEGMDKGAGISRKGSMHSARSAPLIGESSSSDSMRAEGSGSYAPSLSSPTTSSPTFTFVPHSAQPNNSGPLSLDSLPSYPPDQKPPFSYPVLIRLAILGSPQKRLLLSQIYAAIEEKFPWYRDSAPKAWKASVRHCLSLNKEFVRMQRAVEDPGVGCGGWWSVGEGMKGLKRPRKRRTPQGKRDMEGEQDTPIIKPPTPILRRRHSTHSNLSTDPYPLFIPPTPSSASISPITSPPLQDYSLRLAPLQLPFGGSQHDLSSASSRTLVFGDREKDRDDVLWSGVGRGDGFGIGRGAGSSRGHSHASTPSTSSSYSAQSKSDTSSMSGRRGNPMSISSLLNDHANSIIAPLRSTSLLDTALFDTKPPVSVSHERVAMDVETEDVEMKEGKETPFSSEQTIRPVSPTPQGTTPPSRPTKSRTSSSYAHPSLSHDTPHHQQREKSSPSTRERTPSARPSTSSSRPTTSSGRHPSGRSPTSSSRPTTSSGIAPTQVYHSKKTSPRQTLAPLGALGKKKKGAKAWESVMDLSQMDVESESD